MPGPGSQKAPGDTQTQRFVCSSEVYRLPGQTTCPTLAAQLLGSASPLATVCPTLRPNSPLRGCHHTTAWQASRTLVTSEGLSSHHRMAGISRPGNLVGGSQPCRGADWSSHSSVL